MSARLDLIALGFFLAEVDNGVREVGGDNRGPRIERYLANCDPPINVAAPWCAAAVQYVVDVAAEALDLFNPLNDVRLEALVASYHEWAETHGMIVPVGRPGDLVLYSFGGNRWDHMGLVFGHVRQDGSFLAIEGNTSPGVGATSVERERNGDGVFLKERSRGRGYRTAFVRWWD